MYGQVYDATHRNEHKKKLEEGWIYLCIDRVHHEDSLDEGYSSSNPSQENNKSET
jgi:hypothetical protein